MWTIAAPKRTVARTRRQRRRRNPPPSPWRRRPRRSTEVADSRIRLFAYSLIRVFAYSLFAVRGSLIAIDFGWTPPCAGNPYQPWATRQPLGEPPELRSGSVW